MASASILVIDDDEDVRAVLRDMLRETGHEVVIAEEATLAVHEAEARRFDVAFIDVHMPEHDGLETLRMLRTVSPSTAYVMMSGVHDAELQQTCLLHGARKFLHKPLHYKEVSALIDRLAVQGDQLFSWEKAPDAGPQPSPAAAETAQAAPTPEPVPSDDALNGDVRLRDPCALLRSSADGDVLARFACTVYAALPADCLAAIDWRGRVDDFHSSPPDGQTQSDALSGILVLRDAAHGPFVGPATVRGSEIVAEGPLQCSASLSEHDFDITVRQAAKDASVTLIQIEGGLSRERVGEFSDALRRATRRGRSRVVVEVDGLSSMHGTAVRECLRAVEQLRARNGDLKIAGATGDIWRTIEALGAHHTIRCHATRADAITAFRR
ncbi:MAG: response regulator [Armatimonadota bacterium]|jgi:anti-anti-sigma factor